MESFKKREHHLIIIMLVFLTGLIALHLSVSWNLDYANEIINSRNEELSLCWKLNQQTDKVIVPRIERIMLISARIQALQPKLDPTLRTKIANAILDNSKKYKLSPSLILHLICRESGFNPLAKSSKDAIGLMQVRYKVHVKDMPELAKIKEEEFYHIDNNIKIGCQILRKYIDSKKSLDKALKKYVGGEVKGYVADIYRMMAEWEQGKNEGGKQ